MKRWKWWVRVLERRKGFFRRQSQVQHGVSTNHGDTIGSSMAMSTAVVIDLFICKASIIKFGVQFLAKSKQLPKIKWSKIQEKVPINKFVVRGEVMGFRSLPWVCSQGYVIYTPWYNFIRPLCATLGRLHSDSCSVRC